VKKEGENVHNFPVYTFDKNAPGPINSASKYLVYKDPSKNLPRPMLSGQFEFMLSNGELTSDPNIDFWNGTFSTQQDIAMGADYLGIGIIHKDLKK
jgi:hypothetical protein